MGGWGDGALEATERPSEGLGRASKNYGRAWESLQKVWEHLIGVKERLYQSLGGNLEGGGIFGAATYYLCKKYIILLFQQISLKTQPN